MTRSRTTALAWTLATVSLLTAALAAVVVFTTWRVAGRTELGTFGPAYYLAALPFYPAVGAIVASRRPRNPIGWLFCSAGIITSLWALAGGWASRVDLGGSRLPAGDWAAWIDAWAFAGVVAPAFLLVCLLFPTGRLLSRRWRVVVVLIAVTCVALAISGMLGPVGYGNFSNPLRPSPDVARLGKAGEAFLPLLGLSGLLCVISVVLRYKRADREQRTQIKWFVLSVMPWALALVTGATRGVWGGLETVLAVGSIAGIPVAVGIAILRYRLYDIDLVISKTLVYAVLTAAVVGIYVAIVVGAGRILGAQRSLALTVVATGVIALGFGPFKQWVQARVNRLVFGDRVSPYEALSGLARRLGNVMGAEALGALEQTVRRALDDSEARLVVEIDGVLRDIEGWPASSGGAVVVPIETDGERLGAYVLSKPASDQRLVGDLVAAGRVGLSTHRTDLALAARARELEQRTVELAASRRRIVTAADTERRRIERNIHDGAQQRLVAAAVQIRMAAEVASEEPSAAREVVTRVRADLADATNELRELARGIYPAILTDAGLAPALRALGDRSPIPTSVDIDTPRLDQERAAALYFCCAEALQNAAKYSRASLVRVRVVQHNGEIVATVTDDGVGFDPASVNGRSGTQNMDDRLAALGGRAEITSAPGGGCTVELRVPPS